VVLHVIGERCLCIPFEFYHDFVIEERHGFNKKTVKVFLLDEIKTFCLSMFIGNIFLVLVIWVIHWGGKTFYFWLWGLTMAFSFVMLTVYPNFIAPLFNKFEDLKNQSLKEKIETLVRRYIFFFLIHTFQPMHSTSFVIRQCEMIHSTFCLSRKHFDSFELSLFRLVPLIIH
jgi:hypothetical protein